MSAMTLNYIQIISRSMATTQMAIWTSPTTMLTIHLRMTEIDPDPAQGGEWE